MLNNLNVRSMKTEKRTATVTYRPETMNVEKRTVDFVMATDAVADFGGYFETLGLDDGELRTKRLDDAIVPLLDSHATSQWKIQTTDDQLGVVAAWRKDGSEVIGTLRFSKDERSERNFQKVVDGILKTGSIGYFVYRVRNISGPDDKKATFRAIDWEIVEFSLVSIPRDPNAQVRSNQIETIETIIEEIQNNERTLPMTPAPVPAPTALSQADVDAAVKANQSRILDIQATVRSAGLAAEVADDMITRGLSHDQAKGEVLEKMIQKNKSAPHVDPTIDVNIQAENEKAEARVKGMMDALEHRLDGSVKVEGMARNFVGMTMLEMNREALRLQGKSVHSMDRETLIRSSFQSTSDFPIATGNLLNKKIKDAYAIAYDAFKDIVDDTSRSDFKESASVTLGSAPELKKIKESGEFETGLFSESSEKYKIDTFGRKVGITRQALINDDMGLFNKIGPALGLAGGRKTYDLVLAILKAYTMGDGLPLFDAAHNNLQAGTTATLEGLVEKLTVLLRKQTNKDGENLRLNLGYLIVGAGQEIAAKKLVSAVNAAKSSDVNVFSNTIKGVIVDPGFDDKDVIVTGRKGEVDLIEVAYLNGFKGVNIRKRDSTDILGVEWDVFMDVGAAPADFRGFAKGKLT